MKNNFIIIVSNESDTKTNETFCHLEMMIALVRKEEEIENLCVFAFVTMLL